jgi:hypothetical protein
MERTAEINDEFGIIQGGAISIRVMKGAAESLPHCEIVTMNFGNLDGIEETLATALSHGIIAYEESLTEPAADLRSRKIWRKAKNDRRFRREFERGLFSKHRRLSGET